MGGPGACPGYAESELAVFSDPLGDFPIHTVRERYSVFNPCVQQTLARGGTYGRYLPGNIQAGTPALRGRDSGRGHLVDVHQGTPFAAPMDVEQMELTERRTPVADQAGCRAGGQTLRRAARMVRVARDLFSV